MSVEQRTSQEVADLIVASLEAKLGQTVPLLPKSFIRVLSKVLGAVFVLLYKYSASISLQMFVQTASNEDIEVNGVTINPLRFWGRLLGAGDPVAATSAQLTVEITVNSQVGQLLSGTQLVGAKNGVVYLTQSTINLNAPLVYVDVVAVSDQSGGNGEGAIGNLEIGDTVSFVNGPLTTNPDTVVTALVVTGADAEDTEVYRQRILDRAQKRPEGGAYSDYELWGEETAGIVSIYPYTSECPGQVDVYVEATEASSGSADGIPTTAQLEAVRGSINLDVLGLATRRPVGSLVNTFPISRKVADITVLGLDVENTARTQNSIQSSLEAYFLTLEPYIEGLSVLPKKDKVAVTTIAGIVDDIVREEGGVFTGVTLRLDTVIYNLYALAEGEKTKLGVLDYL